MKRWLLLALAASACSSDPPPPIDAELGGFDVHIEPRPARLIIHDAGGRVVLESSPDGIRFRHAEADFEMLFGAFRIEETTDEPWLVVRELGAIVVDAQRIDFELIGEGGDLLGRGSLAAGAAGVLELTLESDRVDVNRASFAQVCDPDEHFLGFGGQSFDVDHRGQTVPLWVQEDGISKADTDFYDAGLWQLVGRRHSTHTPMPIYLSSRGVAVLLDTPFRSVFAMCSEDPGAVRVEAWEPALRLSLFDGPTAPEALQRLTDRLGRPAIPPRFTFAPWLDALFGSANVRRVADRLRAEDVPASVIWTEDWRGGTLDGTGYALEEDWELDRDLYPDFEAVASDLHAAGYKWLTYNNSFLVSSVGTYAEAVAGGFTVETSSGAPFLFSGITFEPTSLVDLSDPAAVEWTKDKYREGLVAGADGWMADFAEWLPVDCALENGDPMREHNLYPVAWARLNKEVLDEQFAVDGVERLFFLRAAYLGSQPLVSVVWAGDQQTDFTVGDGLPSVIPMGIGLGVTGFPYYGHDIGGYMSQLSEPTSRELWFRWVTLGALSPVMRTHHGRSATENWNWESDAESVAHLRRWAKLHIRLFPYLHDLAVEASLTGMPMMRPLALHYPAFAPGWTSTDQFMLGDRLIVAPVVTEGAVSRTVSLPAGTFYPLEPPGAPLSLPSPAEVTVDAPLGELPALVPAGAVLVLLPDTIDTLTDADPGSGAVTLADVADDRELWLYPGGASRLDERNGLTYDWNGTELDAPATEAAWNGAAATITGDTVDVVGPGTLVVNGGAATLTVTGGAADRRLTIRFR